MDTEQESRIPVWGRECGTPASKTQNQASQALDTAGGWGDGGSLASMLGHLLYSKGTRGGVENVCRRPSLSDIWELPFWNLATFLSWLFVIFIEV